MWFEFFFFFQAEDGIRDLVRSRGLGDVYKRQVQGKGIQPIAQVDDIGLVFFKRREHLIQHGTAIAVSYTHLTLPTSDLV